MTEKEAVDAAYTTTLQKLTTMMFDAFVQTSTPDGRRQAEERFLNGLSIARAARDRAKALLDDQNG